jgi:hypothetical protein
MRANIIEPTENVFHALLTTASAARNYDLTTEALDVMRKVCVQGCASLWLTMLVWLLANTCVRVCVCACVRVCVCLCVRVCQANFVPTEKTYQLLINCALQSRNVRPVVVVVVVCVAIDTHGVL